MNANENPPTFAQLLDALFRTRLRSDGTEHTYTEIERWINATFEGRYHLDSATIGKLRSGKIPNPGRDSVLLMAIFFKVPASYFFPEISENAEPSIEHWRSRLRSALQAAGLSPTLQAYIEGIVEAMPYKLDQREHGGSAS